MENKYISVSALNRYLEYRFNNDKHLQLAYIKAEISNIRISNGIMYFSLKDNESEISALMFSNAYQNLKFNPEDGMTVLVTGKVGVYVKRGTYAVTVYKMEEAGLGEAYLNFLRVKAKLEKEGLFKTEHKLPIPKMSEKIGVITSATGDALHDILSTISKRFPIAEVYLYPSLVQGKDAPRSLIKAINKANDDGIVDVLIIARGGGSVEDLSCFNDEELARTIFHSKIPTISGVGHESDYTICDFVASRRAPTPTGAAVLATREKTNIIDEISNYQKQLVHLYKQKLINLFNSYQSIVNSYGLKNFDDIIQKKETKLDSLINHLNLVSPKQMILNHLQKIKDLDLRLKLVNLEKKINEYDDEINSLVNNANKGFSKYLDLLNQQVEQNIDKLIILNPLNVMKKGYTLTYQDQDLITSITKVDERKDLVVKFHDGEVKSKIIEVKYEKLS
ncbi:MAG TPA: exodeoxyribonuclease VII large subunit [Acholeplasmataceae bacterium]|nr:exodeoxyribonuclease VII large subunit [Acholeplasmataceae bacterium]